MNDLLKTLLLGLGLAVVPVSLVLWARAVDRLIKHQPLLPTEPRRPVPWTIGDLVVIAILGMGVTLLLSLAAGAFGLALPEGEPSPGQQLGALITFSLALLLTFLLAVQRTRARSGATWADLGFVARTLGSDMRLGLVAFVMLVVPMQSLYLLALWVFGTDETHPFIEILLKDPRAVYLIPIALMAVVVAPLVEEFLFRVLLQGWLERAVYFHERRWSVQRPTAGANQALAEPVAQAPDPAADSQIACDTPAGYDRSAPEEVTGLPHHPALRWLPIGVSALLFALAHVGHGPAPIPLFVLALGLGYVYQRTHRIVPCLTIHFLVNLMAVVELAAHVAG